jgi:PAS domain S-box-containing protein
LMEPQHIVEIANERMFELWGKSAEQMLGKPIFEGLPEARNQGFENLLDNVFTTGETFKAFEQPTSLPRKNGIETVYIDFVYEAFRHSNGAIGGVLAVAIDVTDRVLARRKIEENEAQLQLRVEERTQELRKANNELAATNKELEQFTYAASHDMQEPLRKVETFSTLLLTRHANDLNEQGKSYLQRINTSVRRMSSIIQDLLRYSQQSRQEELFVPTDLNRIITEIATDLELPIQQKSATILSDSIPIINAIPSQMNQLFFNLFSNSLKFSQPGLSLVIKITNSILSAEELSFLKQLDPTRDYLKICFADNGIGFEQQYAEAIFVLFKRLHGKLDYEGTGIGLGLCKKVINNHNGAIWAESALGEGAVFSIVLPL